MKVAKKVAEKSAQAEGGGESGGGFEILDLPNSTIPDTYISFATPGQFLGVVVIATPNFEEAMARCIELGLYPGGSALCLSIPPDTYPRERLLGVEDLPNSTLLEDMKKEDVELVLGNSTEFCGGCLKLGVN